MSRVPKWLKRTVLISVVFGAGIGLGATGALILTISDHPDIVVVEKWKTVTTTPPVTYLPETPFHVDQEVICNNSAPPTTPPTSAHPVHVPTTIPKTPVKKLPPSTLPLSSTTSTTSDN